MKKKTIALAMLFILAFSGCAKGGGTPAGNTSESAASVTDKQTGDNAGGNKDTKDSGKTDADVKKESIVYRERRFLIDPEAEQLYDATLTPSAGSDAPSPDLKDVNNIDDYDGVSDIFLETLAKNGFVVWGESGSEFFEIYESNRYSMRPSFVTVDSMMHTYHLYFAHLLKQTEINYLADALDGLGKKMLELSTEQYESAKGTEYEDAALRNVAFFNIGVKLFDPAYETIPEVDDIVSRELSYIEDESGIDSSPLMPDTLEDYTQYKPRGYYDGNDLLERYFKAMMWYGRRNFPCRDDELNKSALLMTVAMNDDEVFEPWEKIYTVTSFFAGAADDAGFYEYLPLVDEAFGGVTTADILSADKDALETFNTLVSQLEPPAINSVPVPDTEGREDRMEENKGFRFMGQRFSIDASIFQKLIYNQVEEDEDGNKRKLPNGLDVPAALGSDTALEILRENGETGYQGYEENMAELRETIENASDTLWSASLYARWLDTLRPLLTVKGEGYPFFMQSEEWAKKSLEGFLGSYSELKHDTILYSKQVLAEMGGGMEEIERDYRGYVEPEPEVFSKLAVMCDETVKGLTSFGMMSDSAKEDLEKLSELSKKLMVIAEKELKNELPTDEEFLLIEDIGGNLEHFWYETVKEDDSDEYIRTYEHPAAVIADIATDPDGLVLEAGIANPSTIYVLCQVDGVYRIARGPVFKYYEFEQPIDERLTDKEWRVMLGMDPTEDGGFIYPVEVEQPEWATGYRKGLY